MSTERATCPHCGVTVYLFAKQEDCQRWREATRTNPICRPEPRRNLWVCADCRQTSEQSEP